MPSGRTIEAPGRAAGAGRGCPRCQSPCAQGPARWEGDSTSQAVADVAGARVGAGAQREARPASKRAGCSGPQPSTRPARPPISPPPRRVRFRARAPPWPAESLGSLSLDSLPLLGNTVKTSRGSPARRGAPLPLVSRVRCIRNPRSWSFRVQKGKQKPHSLC